MARAARAAVIKFVFFIGYLHAPMLERLSQPRHGSDAALHRRQNGHGDYGALFITEPSTTRPARQYNTEQRRARGRPAQWRRRPGQLSRPPARPTARLERP